MDVLSGTSFTSFVNQDWMVRRSAALVEGQHFEWKSSEAALHAAQGLSAQDIETARFCKEFPDVTLACEDGQ